MKIGDQEISYESKRRKRVLSVRDYEFLLPRMLFLEKGEDATNAAL